VPHWRVETVCLKVEREERVVGEGQEEDLQRVSLVALWERVEVL